MASTSASSSYDPNVVIKAAHDKLQAGDVTGGQTLFQSALFNWVDDYQFGDPSSITNKDQLREAVATLWISYAHYLQQARQFKSATEAYEQALACPVAGTIGRVWLDYVRWLEERKKLRSAQNVYLRALVDDDTAGGTITVHPNGGKVTDEQDRELLWNEFLQMMRNINNKPDLSMSALKKAVREEHQSNKNRPQAVESTTVVDAKSDDEADLGIDGGDDDMYGDLENPAAAKKPKLDNVQQTAGSEPTRTHVVLPEQVNDEETALQEIIGTVKTDPQFKAMWMVRDGDESPQAPEPPLFEAAPPKLTDPTGKDLLGVDMALELVERLLEPSGGAILDIARGMWTLTALQEKQSSTMLADFEETIVEEVRALKERHKIQISVAGSAVDAVRTMHETEQRTFEAGCQERRQKLLSDQAWKLREILWIQQQFFTKLKIPSFSGVTVDATELEFQSRVCSYLHSAFFLRKRIGETAHTKMLKTQRKRLEDIQNGIGTPPRGPLNAAAGGRLSPPPMNLPGLAGGRLSPMAGAGAGANPRLSPVPGAGGMTGPSPYFQPQQPQPPPIHLPQPGMPPMVQQGYQGIPPTTMGVGYAQQQPYGAQPMQFLPQQPAPGGTVAASYPMPPIQQQQQQQQPGLYSYQQQNQQYPNQQYYK